MGDTYKKYREMITHCAIDMILIAGDEKKLSYFIHDESLSPLLKTLRDAIEADFLNGD